MDRVQELSEKIWLEFSIVCPEVLNAVAYPFSEEGGEPMPALPRAWTIRLLIFMAAEGHCEYEQALGMIWELVGGWIPSTSS